MDAVKANKEDREAVQMVTRMDALFAVDRWARQEGMTHQQRQAHRREHATEWVNGIQDQCARVGPRVLPQSAMGKAIRYTVNQWSKLLVAVEDGEIELSTNVAENSASSRVTI